MLVNQVFNIIIIGSTALGLLQDFAPFDPIQCPSFLSFYTDIIHVSQRSPLLLFPFRFWNINTPAESPLSICPTHLKWTFLLSLQYGGLWKVCIVHSCSAVSIYRFCLLHHILYVKYYNQNIPAAPLCVLSMSKLQYKSYVSTGHTSVLYNLHFVCLDMFLDLSCRAKLVHSNICLEYMAFYFCSHIILSIYHWT